MTEELEEMRVREGVPTAVLLRAALTEARQLAATELELAKKELRKEMRSALAAGAGAGAAVVMATVGVTMLCVGLSMAVTSWVLALCIGGGFLVLAAGAALYAYARAPKKVLPRTAEGVIEAVRGGAERLA